MKIELNEKFFIEQCLHAPFCWDLVKVTYGKRNGQENTRVETIVAYGLTLELLAKKIADYSIYESEKEVIEFKEYVEQYRIIGNEITDKLIKNLKK